MKKTCITFLLLGIILLIVVGISIPKETKKVEYLRIHIRANSNDEIDQNIKYIVKDKIVQYLTPVLSTCDSKKKAVSFLYDNLENIEKIADETLKENGFNYTSKAKINNEKFPTRSYGDFCLEEGFYDALIVNLGSGKGDNWWCVVYPPLCFTDSSDFVYKSKIIEIINDFKRKREKINEKNYENSLPCIVGNGVWRNNV
ncbi:MAG: stage II sporulation protein R [Clostridia bacterium]|nr:stage II sporulation protein R [Clostridia bacterium]